MRCMETLQDLIEEAKVRVVWWGLCIFGISYFISHTSNSMWTNIPISILILCALRYLSYEVEFRWKVRPVNKQSYLSHLQRIQISPKDPQFSALPRMPSWRKNLNSPPVETAICDFINKVLQDFVVDLWYSSITPDKDAPALIRTLILDVIGGISVRIKEINLVDLLTRDVIELIGNHLDLFRRNKSIIGVDVIDTLSLEQIDERLKQHLLSSGELHPALKSPECEYKVLQQLISGILGAVLEPSEAQCPLVQCFSGELVTCLVLQPVMNLASPAYINELIEVLFLAYKDGNINTQWGNAKETTKLVSHDHSIPKGNTNSSQCESRVTSTSNHGDMMLEPGGGETSFIDDQSILHREHAKTADWARVLDAATQRRTEVLMPENLENMWTKGRNYKMASGHVANAQTVKEMSPNAHQSTTNLSERDKMLPAEGGHSTNKHVGQNNLLTMSNKYQLKRSSSTSDLKNQMHSSDLKIQRNTDTPFSGKSGDTFDPSELYCPNSLKKNEDSNLQGAFQTISLSEESLHTPKLRCRVKGAFYEKISSDSFAVYSISVADAENTTWFVKRRYRNFERLHRYLKDIPNYTLHLPPKRFLSSNLEEYFVLQRCILLNKYLQDLLSIANIAEQHEVWDFLSASSKNYSYGKSSSVMKTLVVNVDDAMDDIVRQFKSVSVGLQRKVVGSSSSSLTTYPRSPSSSLTNCPQSPSLSLATCCPPENEKKISMYYTEEYGSKPSLSCNMERTPSLSDDDIHGEEGSVVSNNEWNLDNEMKSKSFLSKLIKPSVGSRSFGSRRNESLGKVEKANSDQDFASNVSVMSGLLEDQISIPPEWLPANVSLPILNLVDNIFQLKQRGWLRRQVFWISKQVLQLMMEDAIDDWLLRQIHWLRRDDVVAQGIRWVQDVLWPNGIFFTKLNGNNQSKEDDTQNNQKLASDSNGRATDKVSISFEQQLEAARRASYVKKIILGGAPTTLVNLIGANQYRRCAKDIYHFLQSNICIKQLAYGVLELLLITVFPELHDTVQVIHQKSHSHTAK